jgi:hypothetical protein
MIKKALLGGLRDGVIKKEELYHLDDQGLFALTASRSHPLFPLANMVRDGRIYPAAAEFSYDDGEHRGLLDIQNRFSYEKALAEDLSEFLRRRILPEEIIIDVPEPVSFETGLYVTDEDCDFAESSSAFKAEGPAGFEKSLRIIRIFIDPIHEMYIKSDRGLQEILHTRKKWLHL